MTLCFLGRTLEGEERDLLLLRKEHRMWSLKTYAVWVYVTLIAFVTTPQQEDGSDSPCLAGFL